MTELTPQRELFAQGIAKSLNKHDAYVKAYPKAKKWKDTSIDVNASKLSKDTKVMLRVEELKKELAEKCLWTREQSVKVLVELLNRDKDKAINPNEVINTIKELNSMHGFKEETLKHIGDKNRPVSLEFSWED